MEDQATVLARLLAVAATATASSLVDTERQRTGTPLTRNPFENATSSGTATDSNSATSGDSPSENSFDGFLAGLRSGLLAAELSNSLRNANNASPRRAMNFFRMFRFTNAETVNESEPNLVPILIVGVRAVENAENTEGEESAAPASTESSASAATTDSASQTAGNDDAASTAPVSESAASSTESVASESATTSSNARENLLNALMERYGGVSSSANASTTDPQSARPAQPAQGTAAEPETTTSPANEAPASMEQQARQSWIVYVFGGTYPENHPILLAPTLFSDDPSYEDLMILESFMGQVKPPVATKEEVNNAGGLFKYGVPSEDGTLPPQPEGRCLICLSDYSEGEECRILSKCSHSFHSKCIDQWLITGRNSCPLCRGEGVKKTEPQPSHPSPSSSFPSMPTA